MFWKYTAPLVLALTTLVTVLLTGCPRSVPYVTPPQLGAVSMAAQDWSILYSFNMPPHPAPLGNGWQIQLPGPAGNLQYVQVPFTAVATPKQVTVTFEVVSKNPRYNGVIDPKCSDPATFHLMLERRGDNGTQDYYRWWADAGGYVFGSADNQEHTITVPLTPDQWSSVYGHHDAAQFAATLGNLNAVGLTFGGTGGCWGHGMNLLSGSGTFELISYTVK